MLICNIREKLILTSNRQHNDTNNTSLGSLVCLPVEVSQEIGVKQQHKTNKQSYIHKGFRASKLAVCVKINM